MTPNFERAVGGMADLPQWFVWRLEWDAAEGKYQKMPAQHSGYPMTKETGGANIPANWSDYDTVRDVVLQLNAGGNATPRYAMGFWLTADCDLWFIDIDMRLCGREKFAATEFAEQLVGAFPGAMVEWSSSSQGLHIIGSGKCTAHRNKPLRDIAKALAPLELEFYTQDRGIAFGLTGEAQGCADSQWNMQPLIDRYFLPREAVDVTVRPEWRGPADDDVLIERMLSARQSAASAFGGKLSVRQLWTGDCEHNSDTDMALASHLAFWTGCDEERIARLMWRSGLRREKWHDRRPHGTYLSFTISNACNTCDNVYQEPERSQAAAQAMYAIPESTAQPAAGPGVAVTHVVGQMISPELYAKVDALLDIVGSCGNELQLHNEVIPQIQAAGVPGALQERLVGAIKKQLKFWGNDMGVAKLRALIFPPAVRSAVAGELPEWAQGYCWVTNGDKFFNTNNAQEMTMVSFQATFGRFMAINDQGRRENACEKCLHFWGMPIVERTGYRPDKPAYFDYDGVSYANLYSPSGVPTAAQSYTAEGIAGIEQYQAMLFDMCARRQDVFLQILYWFAHNVQNPGKKIRWSPIIKGVQGDGKTLLAAVLRSAMGIRNVSTTSNSNIRNSGGFTDWAVRGAVNVIEEIHLTGMQRHMLYNSMKEFITNNVVDINPKGGKAYQTFNTTNHWANTNHNDGLPMEKDDRRWLVNFTPWESLGEMMSYCQLTPETWRARTRAIDHAYNHCAGEFRAWFLSIAIPATFDIDSEAMMTPEKRRMMASSSDSAEGVAESIIADGGVGISHDVLSSSALSAQLAFKAARENFDMPRGIALNYMLTRLGYSKVEKQVKWDGQTHTVWLRNGVDLDNDMIRFRLDATKTRTQT